MARNQHYTQNTVSAEAWCGKCNRRTQHRVDKGRIGPCLECIAKLEEQHNTRMAEEPGVVQGLLMWGADDV